jgi:hypothetical protein
MPGIGKPAPWIETVMQLEAIRQAVTEQGLLLRRGFYPDAEDSVPLLRNGRRPTTVLLLGNAGDAMWRSFRASPEGQSADDGPAVSSDPLDRWTHRIVTALAEVFGAEAVFPFGGPPYYPFQQWACRAEPVWPSPLGVLIHRNYGLWHAYRGALCFDARIPIPEFAAGESPCEACPDRPCLSSCPVSAFNGESYDVPACAAHLATPAGADCMELGCRARRACPVGADFRYAPEQAAFHMQAFLNARPKV